MHSLKYDSNKIEKKTPKAVKTKLIYIVKYNYKYYVRSN